MKLVRQKGLEPPTYCLEGSCSIRMSYWRGCMEQVTRIELASPAWKAGALTIVLHLLINVSLYIVAEENGFVKSFFPLQHKIFNTRWQQTTLIGLLVTIINF